MEDRRTLRLALHDGESRQFLLESGSLVLLLDGEAELRDAPGWLAETVVRPKFALQPEEPHRVDHGGWLEIAAGRAAEIALIPPDAASFWLRVGHCLGRLAGHRAAARKSG